VSDYAAAARHTVTLTSNSPDLNPLYTHVSNELQLLGFQSPERTLSILGVITRKGIKFAASCITRQHLIGPQPIQKMDSSYSTLIHIKKYELSINTLP
jgi:hypothetical protein